MLKELTNKQIENEMDFFYKVKRTKPFVYNEGNKTDIIISVSSALQEKDNLAHLVSRLLNKYYGYSILCNISKNNEDTSFKEKMAELCEKDKPIIVIDLTSLANVKNSDYAINLCTNLGRTLHDDTEILEEVISSFKNYRINKINIDSPCQNQSFFAEWLAENYKQKAVQIELNKQYFSLSNKNIVKLVNAIHLLCQTLRQRDVVRSRHIDIKKLREIDENFSSKDSLNDFEYVNGLPEIVLSAPHAKAGVFENKPKESESMSGSICKILYKEFGFSVIYKSRDNEEDYFNSKVSAYKNALFKNVLSPSTRLFLELHILSKTRVQDVTLFLPEEYDKDKLYQIINVLNSYGLQYFSINSVFDSFKKARTINQIKNKCFKMQICFNERLIEDNRKLRSVVDCVKDIIALFL